MRVEFLPPYSPDYNPIELAFSKFKMCLRSREVEFRALDQVEEEMEIHLFLIDAIFLVSAVDARGYFRHCEYI
jgi:transposase